MIVIKRCYTHGASSIVMHPNTRQDLEIECMGMAIRQGNPNIGEFMGITVYKSLDIERGKFKVA